jgi:antibiotic biosynthesis monooxygenase (ABM) superfamily enzyme
MIERIWHGWTAPEDADRYERLLREEILPGIASRNIAGYRGFRVLRRSAGDEVEFVTILSFESLDAVRSFAGDDHEAAYVPPKAREVLARFDDRVRHFELRDERSYAGG